jgi:hypothetical protein
VSIRGFIAPSLSPAQVTNNPTTSRIAIPKINVFFIFYLLDQLNFLFTAFAGKLTVCRKNANYIWCLWKLYNFVCGVSIAECIPVSITTL